MTKTLGGYRPHSPITMTFEVVAFTFKTHRTYLINTRSISFIPDFLWPQTSLPYVRTGLIKVSNTWNFSFGDSGFNDFVILWELNIAFRALSHKYWKLFWNTSSFVNWVDLITLPKYYSMSFEIQGKTALRQLWWQWLFFTVFTIFIFSIISSLLCSQTLAEIYILHSIL